GEQDLLGLLHHLALHGVANPEIGQIEQRQDTDEDEVDVTGKPEPLDDGVRVRAQVIEGSGVEIADVTDSYSCRMPSGNSVANDIQASPMLSPQKLIFAARSFQRSAGIR